MSDALFVLLQHCLPKRWLTEFIGGLAAYRGGAKTHSVIRWFIKRYGVDMSEAADPRPEAYATFNEFFARPLRSDARTISANDWVCPVDGTLSQAGPINMDQIFQAKGHRYSLEALLAGDTQEAEQFKNGHFATIYLSPKDYHRLHMTSTGRLRRIVYVPGDLYSVNPATVRNVPGLFARNERVICYFDGLKDARPFAMILVGATIVGSIATVWTGVVNQKRQHRAPTEIPVSVPEVGRLIDKGAEMGRFQLGSTIIMLCSAGPSPWPLLERASEGLPLKLGREI